MIHAIILAGGWGRRFWPKSRRNLPKQVLCIGTKRSPLKNLFYIINAQIPKERIWVVANKRYVRAIRGQLPGLPKRNLLVEPLPKNTAAAVGWASIIIKKVDPQAVSYVLPCDQMLGQKRRFLNTLKAAGKLAIQKDALVTIGIRPSRAAVEYGYLKIVHSPESMVHSLRVYKVEKFVEKPNIKKAKTYLKSRKYLWNSGIFVWKVENFLKAVQKYLPQTYSGLEKIEKAQGKRQYKSRLFKEYNRFKDISVDYGIMEKARNIYTVVGNFPWADIGSWADLPTKLLAKDTQGNVTQGLHKGVETSGSVIFSEPEHLIATVGLRDLIVIHTPCATLVCRRNQAQKVKQLTEALEKDKRFRKYL